MSRALLVLRPEPGASATAARAAAMGLEVRVLPLFAVAAVAWDPPDPAGYNAVLLTSANAVRHGGSGLAHYHHLPAHAVGATTAAAARAAGFVDVRGGDRDAAALLAQAAAAGHRRLFHPAGAAVRAAGHAGVSIERRTVYDAVEAPVSADMVRAAATGAVALLHSPRAAARFADLIGAERSALAIAAISPAALAAAGPGWALAEAADAPDDERLLALAARLCD
ncbi:uroporphyrinogen-III synthase [Sphingomonas sp. 1P06PA]|uniref:uroporphyrinogen-III synthase n=1 Tax=Sphingomonas sp. 1P06PA TaxID=554121 RepID=UPI0039A5D966